MSGATPNRWLRAFLHPSHAMEQIDPDITFNGSLGFKAREILWLPVTAVNLAATAFYGAVLTILIGYPLHWRWLIAKLLCERRERAETNSPDAT